MILFDRQGNSRDIPEEFVAAHLKSGDWAENPSAFGIERCPGVQPDLAILARGELPLETDETQEVNMPGDWGDLASMTREQLLEVALNRGVTIDRRWGRERLLEALRDDSD